MKMNIERTKLTARAQAQACGRSACVDAFGQPGGIAPSRRFQGEAPAR